MTVLSEMIGPNEITHEITLMNGMFDDGMKRMIRRFVGICSVEHLGKSATVLDSRLLRWSRSREEKRLEPVIRNRLRVFGYSLTSNRWQTSSLMRGLHLTWMNRQDHPHLPGEHECCPAFIASFRSSFWKGSRT